MITFLKKKLLGKIHCYSCYVHWSFFFKKLDILKDFSLQMWSDKEGFSLLIFQFTINVIVINNITALLLFGTFFLNGCAGGITIHIS